MNKIEYEIVLNKEGRSIIKMSDNYKDKVEDKFFVFEMTRYFLQKILMSFSEKYDENSLEMMDITVRLLGQVGDEMAQMIWDMMLSEGEADLIYNKNYHIVVNNQEELNNIDEYQTYNNKIYYKQDGLKVLVKEESVIYEYQNNEFKKQLK